jgi:hypothetical protein
MGLLVSKRDPLFLKYTYVVSSVHLFMIDDYVGSTLISPVLSMLTRICPASLLDARCLMHAVCAVVFSIAAATLPLAHMCKQCAPEF